MSTIYPQNVVVVSHSVNGVSDSFATSDQINTNNMVKLKFYLNEDVLTATIGTFAKRDGLKYVGVSTEDTMQNIKFRDSSGNTVLDMGSFTAGQTKHSVEGATLDYALPSTSGNDIADVHITRSASTDDTGEINIEIYYNHSSSVTT
tara:strand:- start:137 stop:577 length:441 start_codon:yes stop_codon:yes gene_type:complete